MNYLKQAVVALVVATAFIAFAPSVHAIPTFQVYGSGGTAMDDPGDMDTWFLSTDPFTLVVVGAYVPPAHVTSLDKVTLFVSVPEGEMGTISFFDLGDGIPTLLTVAGTAPEANPTGAVTEDHLTDVAGLDGYDAETEFSPFNLNEHDPTKDLVSDFLLYDLGSFSNAEAGLNDYNASDGTITPSSAAGEQKEYSVSVTGFSRVHFDIYGLVTTEKGSGPTISMDWEQNPGSHDTTWTPVPPPPPPPVIPEPGSMVLLGSGLLAVFGYKRSSRKTRA